MNNQNKNQNQDRKSSPGSDDNRDKYASQHKQGSPQHTSSGSPGSKTAGSDQNRNPQR